MSNETMSDAVLGYSAAVAAHEMTFAEALAAVRGHGEITEVEFAAKVATEVAYFNRPVKQ